jgi:hypothetical protein
MNRVLAAITVGAASVLMFPAAVLAQAAPSPAPPAVPMDNPGASVSGLPFSGTLHDLTMWLTGLGFIACLAAFLAGAGILRPIGHLVGHSGGAIKGTTAMVTSAVGAVLLGGGFVLISFFWHVGQGVH